MDDPNLQLENELKALRPRRPSVLLRSRVARDLGEMPGTAAASPVPTERRRYTSATSLRSWKWIGWQLAAAAAVAVAVTVGVRSSRAPAAPAPASVPLASAPPEARVAPVPAPATALAAAPRDVFEPVKAANVLYDLQDEGLVLLDDQTPARRVRARYVDTYTWQNPSNGASLRWSVPRDEVRMVPTRFQ